MIPKVIHYCWFGKEPLPPLARKCIESWEKYCTGFKIKKWDETNFDINSCQYAKEAYMAEKWAFVSDYARFKILYDEGGIYFDVDLQLVKSIDDLIEGNAFIACETKYYFKDDGILPNVGNSAIGLSINPGLGIAFEKGNAFLKEMLDEYNDRLFDIGEDLFDKTTVVQIVTDMMVKKGFDRHMNKTQIIEGIHIYPTDYFGGKDNNTGKINITDNTYAIHHGSGSWLSGEEKKVIMLHKRFSGKGKLFFIFGCILGLPYQLLIFLRKHGLKTTVKVIWTRLKTGIKVGIK